MAAPPLASRQHHHPMMAPTAPASESALYSFMALASMGAVVLYFVLQTVYLVMDRLTTAKPPKRRHGRHRSGPAAAAAESNASSEEEEEEEEAKEQAPVPAAEADADPFGALLLRVWPAGHVAWTTDARWQPVRRLVPVLPNLIAVLVAVLLVYWFMAGVWSSTGTPGDAAYYYASKGDAGSGAAEAPLAGEGLQWLGEIPYVLETYEVHGQLHKMPVVDCAFATEASRVQDKLLGPPPTGPAAGTGGGVDVDLELRLNRERSYLGELRQKATRRCLLRNETMLDGGMGTGIEARWIQRAALAARVPPMPEATGRVTRVLLARNGTRYMRVLTTRTSATPEPAVVAETTLLDAVRDWHARFLALAKRNLLVYPCICPAHLGLVNSGLHFYYDYEPPAQIGVDKARRGQWHVLYDVQLTPAVDELDDVDMAGFYREYMTHFPLDADAPFNVSSQTHAALSHVHAVDMAALLRTEAGAARLRDAEPMWVTTAAAATAPATPYAAVVDLQTLTLADDALAYVGAAKGLSNACFHHCRALEPSSRAPSAMAVVTTATTISRNL